MTTFRDFIADMPGMPPYALGMFTRIDAEAVRLGAVYRGRNAAEPYAERAAQQRLAGSSPWLISRNQDMANALAVDPRLAALPDLHVWATRPDGVGETWVNWYERLLQLHIHHLAKTQVAA